MPSLWFCVPVHGRLPLAAICLRQLRRTCDALSEEGIEATAVVIADRDNLEELRERTDDVFGFGTIERDNSFVSRRFNDGIQLACDRRYNPRPADFVVPCGSDDWVDHRIFLDLPGADTVLGFQRISFVREDGREMMVSFLRNEGGSGIRVYPRQVVAHRNFRPADEDRQRACDTSTLLNLRKAHPRLKVEHRDIDPRQIVDWKSPGIQLNPYGTIEARHRGESFGDPFETLAEVFPGDALDEMASHYSRELVAA